MGTSKKTVLLVEDEPIIRVALSKHLADQGFMVLEAASAADAIDVVTLHPEIDLVFTDLQMPGEMDGLELVQWLMKNRQGLPVALTSGVWGRVKEMADFGAAEALPYFIKPYRYSAVSARMREMIDAKERYRPEAPRQA